ncbi:MAG: hypothetical protein ACTHN5_01075 [Phycisphaerae bacterium]
MRWLVLGAVLLVTLGAAATQPGSTAATQAATQPATRPRVFTSMMDVLNKTPVELRPKATGEWFKFDEGKFVAWVNEQMVGMVFEEDVQVKAGTVMQNVYQHGPGQEWMVYLSGDWRSFACFGTTHRWCVVLPQIFTDEAGAKKWSGKKNGRRMRLTGTIKSVGINSRGVAAGGKLQLEFGIVLDHPQLVAAK